MSARYQRGQSIPLLLTLEAKADAPPTATITDPNNALLGVFQLPYQTGYSATAFTYLGAIRLQGGAPLGSYSVTFTAVIAGVETTSESAFDAVAGGDSGGEVISLYYYDRPEGRYVLAQLGSGRLVQGRNPHL